MKRLHHVGIVVEDIGKAATRYQKLLGFSLATEIIADPIQKVRVAFLETGSQVLLELVEPLSSDSPVTGALKRGGGLHHLCYEVEALDPALQAVRDQDALVICEPVPAAAFQGRRIAFIYTVERHLIELLETAP